MTDVAIDNAKAWLDTIRGLVTRMGSGDAETADKAREEAYDAPLSVQVREGWHDPHMAPDGPEEYEILLSTGGPALRIRGRLDDHSEPGPHVSLEWQEWGTPWTPYPLTDDERQAVLTFASVFYYS